ncbi:hypothetical protein ABZ499_11705 [Streptomyces sp. NPDC019990]|uniref:hypothetical protein n=1 Tax=Streptomyces sp. NPDC019990 TaxID=3154693 RepID=UPI0033FEC1DA
MKIPRLHGSHRSLAHSAGSAVIVLAAVLTTAAPVAADTDPRAGEGASQATQCRTIQIHRQRGGLEGAVWTVLSGPADTTTDSRCDSGAVSTGAGSATGTGGTGSATGAASATGATGAGTAGSAEAE